MMAAIIVVLVASTGFAADTIRCQLADGFDFPVGKPDADGYYKSRGYWPNGHLGEDWNGRGGGDSDMGDPIYAIGRGVVVLSENVHVGWGNVVIIRHAFRDNTGKIQVVDSLYGHLLERLVKVHQIVERGQLVGKMGSNNGMYPAHLHLEVRKNLQIGMNRSQFARDYSNYYSPTQFITMYRRLQASFQKYEIPVNTFAPYGKTLSELDRSSGSSRGLSIPVFPGAVPARPGAGEPSSSTKASQTQTRQGSADPHSSAPPPTMTDDDDFWTRLKAKFKNGQVVDGHANKSP